MHTWLGCCPPWRHLYFDFDGLFFLPICTGASSASKMAAGSRTFTFWDFVVAVYVGAVVLTWWLSFVWFICWRCLFVVVYVVVASVGARDWKMRWHGQLSTETTRDKKSRNNHKKDTTVRGRPKTGLSAVNANDVALFACQIQLPVVMPVLIPGWSVVGMSYRFWSK